MPIDPPLCQTLWELYAVRPDIAHLPGWETGRDSEPAFMEVRCGNPRTPSQQSRIRNDECEHDHKCMDALH